LCHCQGLRTSHSCQDNEVVAEDAPTDCGLKTLKAAIKAPGDPESGSALCFDLPISRSTEELTSLPAFRVRFDEAVSLV